MCSLSSSSFDEQLKDPLFLLHIIATFFHPFNFFLVLCKCTVCSLQRNTKNQMIDEKNVDIVHVYVYPAYITRILSNWSEVEMEIAIARDTKIHYAQCKWLTFNCHSSIAQKFCICKNYVEKCTSSGGGWCCYYSGSLALRFNRWCVMHRMHLRYWQINNFHAFAQRINRR